MKTRTLHHLATPLLALALTATACVAPSSNNSGTGGLSAGSGGQLDPAPGDLGWGQDNTESAPMKEAHTTHDAHGRTDNVFTDEVEGCTTWFGVSKARSDEYLIAADKYGIGGHVQWKCSGASSIARLHVDVKLRWALTPAGPWTDESGPNADRTYTDTVGYGTAMVFNDTCTTDYWQVGFRMRTEEATQGGVVRPWIWSQWRKVTSEDCARE